MVGGILGEGLPLAGAVFCALGGILIILVCMCFVGVRSCKSGLPSTVISADGLGVWGARCIPALLISITGIGWFGVQAAVCGASFSIIMAENLGISVPAWAATLFWGLVVSVFAMQGYRALRQFYYTIAPVLLALVVYTAIYTLFFSASGSVAALFAWHPAKPMSSITGISLVVGGWAMAAYVVGDYCRYAKKKRDAALGISVGIIMILVMVLSGAIFRIVTGNADITVILYAMGYPAMSLVFLILSNWAINVMNAYFGGIAVSVLLGLPEKRLKLGTAFTGITGAALGAAGILSRYTEFLGLLSSFIPPLIGVLAGTEITHILRRRKNTGAHPLIHGVGKDVSMWHGFHIPGIIAYALGALAAWLTTSVVPFFIPPLNGISVAAAVYVVLDLFLVRGMAKTTSKTSKN
jgi:cytosine permease